MSTNQASERLLTSVPGLNAAGLTLTGVNFKTSELAARERLALVHDRYEQFLSVLHDHPQVRGAVILSTCNRTEVVTVASSQSPREYQEQLVELWSDISGVERQELAASAYHLHHLDTVRHVFRVAAGLDSMILGEPQVLGQMKQAFRHSCSLGLADSLLHRLFQSAFHVAKSVRSHTAISRYPVSVAYAARELSLHIFGDLSDASVLLLGAGETGSLALRHLREAGASSILVANRSAQRARQCAEEFDAALCPWERIPEALFDADIVIAACGLGTEDEHVVEFAEAQRAASARKGRLQLYVDLGLPRNIAEEVGTLSDVFLYNIDDLQSVVQQNQSERERAAEEAERLVLLETQRFEEWVSQAEVHEQIRAARKRVAEFEELELRKSLRRLRRNGFTEQQCALLEGVLRDYSDGLVAKVLHQPFRQLSRGEKSAANHKEAFAQYFLARDAREVRYAGDAESTAAHEVTLKVVKKGNSSRG